MKKRLLSIFLAAALSVGAAGALSGCGGKGGANVDVDEIMSREDVENYVYPEQIEIKIPVYDRGNAGQANVTDNYWTKYVQQEFGDKHNIKVTYISIPRKEEVTMFNQLLAGKAENQPDIIFNYDYPTIVSFANQEAFQELDEEMIKKYAPDFYERTKELDEYTYVDGKKLFMAGTRPDAYNFVTLVRKDWLDKLGLDEPKDKYEHTEMLKKFRDAKLGGENTIPSTYVRGNANYGNYGYRPYPLSEEDNALYSDITVASLTWEPTYKQLKWDNMLYNEGLISPEWYLDVDGSKAREAFVSGQAGTYADYLSKSPDVINTLKANVPDAEVTIFGAYDDPDFGHPGPGRRDNPFGMVSGINVNCAHPEAIMMYFEWLNDNLFVMQNGIEGVTYKMDGDIPVLIDGYEGEDRLNYNGNKDMWCLVIEGRDLGDEELNVKAQAKSFAPEGYEFIIEKSYENAKFGDAYRYTDYIFSKPVESLTTLSGTLMDNWLVHKAELINCKPEEFDAKYEAACADYLAAGYQQVLDEKKALYEEEKK